MPADVEHEHPATHRRIGTGGGRAGHGRPVAIAAGFLALLVVVALLVAHSTAPSQTVRPVHNDPILVALASTPDIATDCPWLARAMARHESPADLARLVVGRMTLNEKLSEIVLTSLGPYENVNSGVPRLCIPPLTLQDGPEGLAYGDSGVTQLPAPLGLAATFDPALARSYGDVEGAEAAAQGFDVVQGPTLDLLRVPEDGRAFESFGEDPVLAADLGVADIDGIQSHRVMAQAKEFAVYSQETDRGSLDDQVSSRPLEELYLRPFEAAVKAGHVASVMCAYPQLNGVYQCQDASVLGLLDQWGFTGFVRSDLGAVHDPAAALGAGTDLIKPASVAALTTSIDHGLLSVPAVDRAVERVLATMFTYGVIGRDPTGAPGDPVDSPERATLARQVAARAAVLLQNHAGVLPLSVARDRSVAVIGGDAERDPVTTGFGSSRVDAPVRLHPARRHPPPGRQDDPRDLLVRWEHDRTPAAGPPEVLTPASGQGHGLTLTLVRAGPEATSLQTVEPAVDTSIRPYPGGNGLLRAVGPDAPVEVRQPGGLTGQLFGPSTSIGGRRTLGGSISERATRSDVVLPPGWTDVDATWTGTLTPPKTGATPSRCRGPAHQNYWSTECRPCRTHSATSSADGRRRFHSLPACRSASRWSGTRSTSSTIEAYRPSLPPA